MLCPICDNELSPVSVMDFTVLACRGGCAGLWFESGTLQDVDDSGETAGLELLNVESDPSINIDTSQRRNCPCCPDIVMQRRFYSPFGKVEIDECPSCGGIWLDHSELQALRTQFQSSSDRNLAGSAHAAAAIDLSSELHQQKKRTGIFLSVARFLGHMWHDYGFGHFRGRDWPPWKGSFRP